MNQAEKMELLKQAWKEVFEVEEVAEDADFFEEGGDSIKAVQLSSWLLQKGIKLDLGKIFYTPVLSEMASALEDTDPVYVPDQMMTKDLIGEKMDAIMADMGQGQAQSAHKAEKSGNENEQICDPNQMQQGRNDGQVCDPNQMQQGVGQEYHMMMSMFQTILGQQQVMLQMMQLAMTHMTTPMPRWNVIQRHTPPAPPFHMRKGASGMPGKHIPPAVREALGKEMKKYASHKVDKPIEEPNVIGIKPAKVTKPEHSAEEVLDHVVSGILNKGYSRTKDLFEQGLTSLDTVKMVTRCGEHGYALSMQDIYMKSTFDELLKCMKPGE